MSTKRKMMKWRVNKNKSTLKGQIGSFLLVLVLFVMGLTSCTFDTNEFKPIVVPDTVSFMNDVAIPIFETRCAYSGCHYDNGIPPNLVQEKAYKSLQIGYINTSEPERSLLYEKIETAGSMAIYATDQDRKIILTWIEQGATNN